MRKYSLIWSFYSIFAANLKSNERRNHNHSRCWVWYLKILGIIHLWQVQCCLLQQFRRNSGWEDINSKVIRITWHPPFNHIAGWIWQLRKTQKLDRSRAYRESNIRHYSCELWFWIPDHSNEQQKHQAVCSEQYVWSQITYRSRTP